MCWGHYNPAEFLPSRAFQCGDAQLSIQVIVVQSWWWGNTTDVCAMQGNAWGAMRHRVGDPSLGCVRAVHLREGCFSLVLSCWVFFFLDFIYLFLERGKRREKVRERNIDVQEKHPLVASCMHPDEGQTQNSGMCPDWESNQQPFSLRDDTQPTEPHQSGLLV